jgi:hypothetical protein
MKRTASVFRPDMNIEGVSPSDIMDNTIEARHIANNEVDPNKSATLENSIVTPVVIQKEVETGAATVDIFDEDAPFKFRIVDVVIEPRGASTNGTMKLTDGTSDITNAMTCAVDKTIARAGTIDDAKSTIPAGGSLVIVCAGDAVADTIGLVTVHAVKID